MNRIFPATGQGFGPDVIAFALLVVGPRQHDRISTRRGDLLQAGRLVIRREDDSAVGGPHGALKDPISPTQRHDRCAGARRLLEIHAVHKPDPLSVR